MISGCYQASFGQLTGLIPFSDWLMNKGTPEDKFENKGWREVYTSELAASASLGSVWQTELLRPFPRPAKSGILEWGSAICVLQAIQLILTYSQVWELLTYTLQRKVPCLYIKFVGTIGEEGCDEGKTLRMRVEREKSESGEIQVSVWGDVARMGAWKEQERLKLNF